MFPKNLQHAVDCTAPDRSEFALKAITKFVNFGSRSLFPVFVSKAHCCAPLTALSKKKGGVRPIAVGEVLRRLIAKCLASEAKSEAIELFDSLQLGVGISGGAEAIIHLSKITYDSIVSAQTDEGVLQIDFQNAFNSVKRKRLLKATYKFIPGIAAFTNVCYSQHTPLFYNNAIIQKWKECSAGWSAGTVINLPDVMADHTEDQEFSSGFGTAHFVLRWWVYCWFWRSDQILANEGPERGLFLRKDKCGQLKI